MLFQLLNRPALFRLQTQATTDKVFGTIRHLQHQQIASVITAQQKVTHNVKLRAYVIPNGVTEIKLGGENLFDFFVFSRAIERRLSTHIHIQKRNSKLAISNDNVGSVRSQTT
jgi:hypothetical protein